MLPSPIELFSTDRRLAARSMLATLERVKDAVRRFEEGEINLQDAIRCIDAAIGSRRAA